MSHDLGFFDRWINWLIQCTTITSFKIIANGKTRNSFQPERNIRQGDTLYTYIFMICAVCFRTIYSFMSTQVKSGIGFKVTKHKPNIP